VNRSESIAAVAGAMAKARAEFQPIVKDKTANVQTRAGVSYSFDYADLGTVLDAVTPALTKNGIAVLQAARVDGDKVIVETMLAHSSGEWLSSDLAVRPDDLTPQKVGGAITYARRYALSAMVGVFSEADDDGNHASGNDARTARREPRRQDSTARKAADIVAQVEAAAVPIPESIPASEHLDEEPPPPSESDPLADLKVALAGATTLAELNRIGKGIRAYPEELHGKAYAMHSRKVTEIKKAMP